MSSNQNAITSLDIEDSYHLRSDQHHDIVGNFPGYSRGFVRIRYYAVALLLGGVLARQFNLAWQLHFTTNFKVLSTRNIQRPPTETVVDQYGAWIGNHWIPPPGKKLYSTFEIQTLFKKHSVLWIGDSTSRRAYATLYGILESDEPHVSVNTIDAPNVINVNKIRITEPCEKTSLTGLRVCRIVPGTPIEDHRFYDSLSIGCLPPPEIEKSWSNITRDYSLVIVSLGVWEVNNCKNVGPPNSTTFTRLTGFLEALFKLQGPSLTVLWRTSGFIYNNFKGNDYLEEFNEQTIREIDSFNALHPDSNITYVDWGSEIFPRSNGPDRIMGDTRNHYGLEARLVLIQLVMNELDRRSQH